jgi:A/G-specific adenine glycosylase
MTPRASSTPRGDVQGEGPIASPTVVRWFRRKLLDWFASHGREFPWRQTQDPYRVLIAEVLLHRTRSDLAARVYGDFIERYPTAAALAVADVDEVVATLRPLGFVHRSARLPELGRALLADHGGVVPSDRESLLRLPGVGSYMANAVLALAFDRTAPLLDPNVIRVLERFFGMRSERLRARDDKRLWSFLERLVPRTQSRDFNLALVDFGSTVCRKRPLCPDCPLRARCDAYANGTVEPLTAVRR